MRYYGPTNTVYINTTKQDDNLSDGVLKSQLDFVYINNLIVTKHGDLTSFSRVVFHVGMLNGHTM